MAHRHTLYVRTGDCAQPQLLAARSRREFAHAPGSLLVLGNARSACLGTEHPQKPLGRRANFPGPARRMYADTPRNASDGS